MPLNRQQIERVRVLTGHQALELRHIRGWDEHLVEDYLAMLDELAARLADHHTPEDADRYDRQQRRLCNVLGVHPGADSWSGGVSVDR